MQRNKTSFSSIVVDLLRLEPNSHQPTSAIIDAESMKIPRDMAQIRKLRRQILQSIDDQMSHSVLPL
jgi:hypothetical protein